jgi:hypothetical protein
MQKTFFLLLISFLYSLTSFANHAYVYEEETAGQVSTFTWDVEKEDNYLKLIAEDEISTTIIKCSADFHIFEFYYKSKTVPTEFIVSQIGKNLIAKGRVNNRYLEKVHKIDLPWIQQFGFGLRPFVLSKEKSIKLCLISPEDFSLQKMVAKKEENEVIFLNNQKYDAIRVTLTLPGFKSMFWKARLWFDRRTGDFLKYSANKGPHTPTTTTILKSKEKEPFFN